MLSNKEISREKIKKGMQGLYDIYVREEPEYRAKRPGKGWRLGGNNHNALK